MWTKTKSLLLSRILTAFTAGLFLILTFFIPDFAMCYKVIADPIGLIEQNMVIALCIGLYTAELLGFVALFNVNRLLGNISKEIVFDESNTKCLRFISWACLGAGVVFAVMALWSVIFALASLFAVFLGLILRVLKNVFEKAVEIKSENDFTI